MICQVSSKFEGGDIKQTDRQTNILILLLYRLGKKPVQMFLDWFICDLGFLEQKQDHTESSPVNRLPSDDPLSMPVARSTLDVC